MNRKLRKHILTCAAIAVIFTISTTQTWAQSHGHGGGSGAPSFVIAKLDDGNGAFVAWQINDVNNLREVVGLVDQGAAYWTVSETNGSVQSTLSLLAGGQEATGINDAGEIVGTATDSTGNWVAVYWQSPTAVPIELPSLSGNAVSRPNSISNDGVIGGYVAANAQDWDSTARAVAWRVTISNGSPVISGPVDLPAPANARSVAQAVSNNDENGVARIVGAYRETGTAVRWEVMSMSDGFLSVSPTAESLPLAGALATGITHSGVVCGRTDVDAIVWDTGRYTVLNRPKGRNRVPRAWAWDINDSGLVVGEAGETYESRACIWNGRDGSLTYLDNLLGSNSPLQGLNRANAVNAFGDIVGDGWTGGFIAISQ